MATETITVAELREYIAVKLPEYMIPSLFVTLEAMPLTPNGKIDRKRLPEPNLVHTGVAYEPPTDDVETKLVQIWQEILKLEKIGIQDSFFDLGGHSLRAVTLSLKIHKEFNVQLPLREIYNTFTIKGLAKFIREAQTDPCAVIKPAGAKEYYPASAAQSRLFVVNQLEGVGTTYHTPGGILIEGEFSAAKLKTVFNKLIERHEILRTSFELFNNEVVQRVHPEVEFSIEYSEAENSAPEVIEKRLQQFIRPFDLSKAPLLRVGLIKLAPERHLLMYDMHHIITDGTSKSILVREFISLYSGETLPELRIRYKDFAEWQSQLWRTERMLKQEKYWLEKLFGLLPQLNLPTDYQRPPVLNFEGATYSRQTGIRLTDSLKKMAFARKTSLYMILLGAFHVLLYKYSRQKEILIGSPVAGRPHADLEQVMGMFVNTVVMRNRLDPNQTFGRFLDEVRQNALEAFENQDYPFDRLVEKLKIHREANHNPLFDVMFVLQNTEAKEIKIPGLKFTPYLFENHVARFDLLLIAAEQNNRLELLIEYSSRLFARETIQKMADHFVDILEQIAGEPEVRISQLELPIGSEWEGALARAAATGPTGQGWAGRKPASRLDGTFDL